MNQHILYNFASRGRYKQFFEVVDTIKKLSATSNYTILAKFDIGDGDSPNDARLEIYYPEVKYVRMPPAGKIGAINFGILDWAEDIIVNISDDTIPNVRHFDNIIRKHTGPDDFVLFPEPYAESQAAKGKNERIAVMSVMGIDYFRRFNYIYWHEYKSFFCDNEATQVARLLGRCKDVDDVIFYHKHPTAGYATNDDTYKRNMVYWNHDKNVYYKRKAINFGI